MWAPDRKLSHCSNVSVHSIDLVKKSSPESFGRTRTFLTMSRITSVSSRRPPSSSALAVSLLCCCLSGTVFQNQAHAFTIPPPESFAALQHALTSTDPSAAHHALLPTSTTTLVANAFPADVLSAYKNQLAAHPLPTKMMTGATVALVGDALAQSRDKDVPYDRRRAASFMTFDACYRWLQHETYPTLVANLQGQYLGGLVGAIPPLSQAAKALGEASGTDPTFLYSTMEQTLSSQLGIVPFIYYPVFYTITGILQQLTVEQTIERARETFIPLMKRNLLFWIPVQYLQFGFVEENLQIPFITVCGLIWTIILSVMAGAAQKNTHATEDSREAAEHYCVTGTEPGCEIDPDDLFPHVLEEVIDMDAETRLELEGKLTSEAETQRLNENGGREKKAEAEGEAEEELVGL